VLKRQRNSEAIIERPIIVGREPFVNGRVEVEPSCFSGLIIGKTNLISFPLQTKSSDSSKR